MSLLRSIFVQQLMQIRRLGHNSLFTTSAVLNNIETKNSTSFDESLLEYLVCPLSKKPLRYDKEKSELVCDELNVAYPIINGIPNLVPQDARMLNSDKTDIKPDKK